MPIGREVKSLSLAVARRSCRWRPREEPTMAPILLMLSIFPVYSIKHCSSGVCGLGVYLDEQGQCVPCQEGTYMPLEEHGCRNCFICTPPGVDEKVVENCTLTSDTKTSCKAGMFRNAPNVPEARFCSPCSECQADEQVLSYCTDSADTVCEKITSSTHSMPEGIETQNVTAASTDTLTDLSSTVNTSTATLVSHTTDVPDTNTSDNGTTIAVIVPVVVVVAIFLAFLLCFVFKKTIREGCTQRGGNDQDHQTVGDESIPMVDLPQAGKKL